MTKDEIKQKVNEFLIDELEIDEAKIYDDANIKDDVGIDSLDYVDIGAYVAKTLGFKINSEDFKNLTTLGQLYDYIAERQVK